MKYTGKTGEYFEIQYIDSHNCEHLKEMQVDTLRLLWFTSEDNQVEIDGMPFVFNTNDIVCLTQFHQLEYQEINMLNLLRFNRPFYCILDHDSEVGCKGILYYGAAQLPIISPTGLDLEILDTAWKMATLEFEMRDNLQLEMLQMMLKRILILCTRVYKNQQPLKQLDLPQNNIVREFNYLVETHFKKKHHVSDYADLLFKSPKTISNIFKKLGKKKPSQFIQDRLMLEARRQLWYSKKDISQIADDIGFNDIHTFSRFFKNHQGASPREFRLRKSEKEE